MISSFHSVMSLIFVSQASSPCLLIRKKNTKDFRLLVNKQVSWFWFVFGLGLPSFARLSSLSHTTTTATMMLARRGAVRNRVWLVSYRTKEHTPWVPNHVMYGILTSMVVLFVTFFGNETREFFADVSEEELLSTAVNVKRVSYRDKVPPHYHISNRVFV